MFFKDVVIMAEVVEKFFTEKISMMPPEEYEIVGKSNKPVVKAATSTSNAGEPITEPIEPIEPIEPLAKRGKKTIVTSVVKTRSIPAGRVLT